MTTRRAVQLPPASLQADFVRFCGGDPSRYARHAPPHLFPQWTVPVALALAQRLPYPPLSVINLGCTLKIDGQLPTAGLVDVACTLTELVEKEGKVRLTLSLRTLFENEVRLRSELRLLVRLATRDPGAKPPSAAKPAILVPFDVLELVRRRLSSDAGLEFAQLTGDFNPIHWVPAYARAVGFKSAILHGFGSFGLAFEALVATRLSGRFEEIGSFDADFTAPLSLPRELGVFLRGGDIWVADAPLGPAYMVGRATLR